MLPDLPPIGDFVPGYEASQWYGLGAPKNTPAEIIDKLNTEINAGARRPRHEGAGLPSSAASRCRARPPISARLIADETEKWAKVVHAAGIKAE